MRTLEQALADYSAALDAGDFAGAGALMDEIEDLRENPLAAAGIALVVDERVPPGETILVPSGGGEPVKTTVYREERPDGGVTISNVPAPKGRLAEAIAQLPEGSGARALAEANAAKPKAAPPGNKVGAAKEYAKGQRVAFHRSPGHVGWPDNIRQVEPGTVGVVTGRSDTNPTGYEITIDYGDQKYTFWTSSAHFGPFK